MKGRIHRLRNFDERAAAFKRAIEKEKGSRDVYRDPGHKIFGLKVGTGQYKRLVYKRGYIFHAEKAAEYYERLIRHFKERGYEPGSYTLVKPRFFPAGETIGVIQEYFERPTLSEAHGYFAMRKQITQKERVLHRKLSPTEAKGIRARFFSNKDSFMRCKRLFNEPFNKNVDEAQMAEVEREFEADRDYVNASIKHDNIIILGQTRETVPRIRLAIIDY